MSFIDDNLIVSNSITTHHGGTVLADEGLSLAFAPPFVKCPTILVSLPLVTDDDPTRLSPAVAPVPDSPALPLPALPELTFVLSDKEQPPFSISDDNAADSPVRFPSLSSVSESLTL